MVSKVIIVFAALCVFQAFAKPTEDKGAIQTVYDSFSTSFDTFANEFKKVFNVEDTKETKEISAKLNTFGTELAGNLDKWLDSAKAEVENHSGDASKAFEALKTKVEDFKKKLEQEHPTETAKLKEYEESMKNAYNHIAAEVKKTADIVEKDTSGFRADGEKYIKSLMTDLKATADKLNTEFKKTLEEHAKEHKH